MYRTGVMAPPDLYDHPPQPGLMARGSGAPEVGLRSFLWIVAVVLGVVEVLVETST